jgi:hypothetical protein
MENVLANIEGQVSPAATSAGTPVALKVGHINYGADLYNAFAAEATENTKVKVIIAIAETGMSPEEFKGECKKATELADVNDKANGFTPKDGAKGAEKYGPLRRVLNQRLSEAKQIFGAYKVNPSAIKEKGYWAALAAARDTLDAKGCAWDGSSVSPEAKKAAKESRAMQKALGEAIASNPMAQPAELVETAKQLAFDAEVDGVAEAIVKKYGKGDVLHTACMRILDQICSPEQLDELVQFFGESAMIKRMEALKDDTALV